MGEKQSDQTEKPTPKKLQDARKDGNVSRSQDLSKTLLLLIWLGMLGMMLPGLMQHWLDNTETLWQQIPTAKPGKMIEAMLATGKTLLVMVLPPVFIAAVTGMFIEFLQVGPVFALKPVKPDLNRLNPVEGFKKMFSQRNFVELVKSVAKALIIATITILVLRSAFADILKLPYGIENMLAQVLWHDIRMMLIGASIVFLLVSVLDVAYQKYAYIKDLMMSHRDIRQEHKNSEGDPMLKGKRRQLHQEWSQENMLGSVRNANVVVTNPTHYAVAIYYEKGKTDLPMVTAKGEDYLARMIRETAQEAGVPIMENVDLARALYRDIAVEHYISSEFFEAVAQLLHWAESVKRQQYAEIFGGNQHDRQEIP